MLNQAYLPGKDNELIFSQCLFRTPCSVLLVLIEVYRISQVRVPFEKIYLLNFFRMGTGIAQDEQSIADVNDVDQSIPDNRVAPHDDLCLEVGLVVSGFMSSPTVVAGPALRAGSWVATTGIGVGLKKPAWVGLKGLEISIACTPLECQSIKARS